MVDMATITENIKNIIMVSWLSKLIKLTKGNSTTTLREYKVPQGCCVYAVGDIHGRADLLQKLHKSIIEDAKTRQCQEKIIVYLGDYVDRGAFVKETIDELLRDDLKKFRREYLMGNHEQLLLNFLEDPAIFEYWFNLGGQATLLSYGVNASMSGPSIENIQGIQEELLEKIPDRHMQFYQSLKPNVQLGDYFFVHAGIKPGIALHDQEPEDIYWIRDEFLSSRDDHKLKIVHGHTVTQEVQNYSNRLCVDTGAYATGILTCAVLEEDQINFLST